MRRLLLLTMLALLCAAAPAHGSGLAVIRDCTDDEVMSKTYTQKDYRDALRQFAADGDQYGNCRDVIRRAQAAAAAGKKKSANGDANANGAGPGGGSTGGGAGAIGSAPAAEQLKQATAAERKSVDDARTAAPGAVAVDDGAVDTARVGTAPGLSQASDLPTPLVLLLALLLAGALAVAGLRVRRLVNARRA
jgi:hypothetical protein